MRKLKTITALLCAALPLTACGGGQPSSASADRSGSSAPSASSAAAPSAEGSRKITPQEALAVMAGEDPFVLLDVRTAEEYAEGYIEGAVLIPDTELRSRAEAELPDKDALILVYCRSGRRSALAAAVLAELGYTRVLDFGGIIDWPYATVSGG